MHNNPRIVKDGLVLLLDGSDINSYPGTGIVWKDLSGKGNDHLTVAAPTFANGIFTLDGTTQGFTRNTAITTSATCTVTIWMKSADSVVLWVMGNSSGGMYLAASSGGNYYHAGCGNPTYYADLNTVVSPVTEGYMNDAWHMFEAKNVDLSTWVDYGWFLYPDPWKMAGMVAVIMIHDRILTAAESAKNYNALKARFGK